MEDPLVDDELLKRIPAGHGALGGLGGVSGHERYRSIEIRRSAEMIIKDPKYTHPAVETQFSPHRSKDDTPLIETSGATLQNDQSKLKDEGHDSVKIDQGTDTQ